MTPSTFKDLLASFPTYRGLGWRITRTACVGNYWVAEAEYATIGDHGPDAVPGKDLPEYTYRGEGFTKSEAEKKAMASAQADKVWPICLD